jgi:hypothetical protein
MTSNHNRPQISDLKNLDKVFVISSRDATRANLTDQRVIQPLLQQTGKAITHLEIPPHSEPMATAQAFCEQIIEQHDVRAETRSLFAFPGGDSTAMMGVNLAEKLAARGISQRAFYAFPPTGHQGDGPAQFGNYWPDEHSLNKLTDDDITQFRPLEITINDSDKFHAASQLVLGPIAFAPRLLDSRVIRAFRRKFPDSTGIDYVYAVPIALTAILRSLLVQRSRHLSPLRQGLEEPQRYYSAIFATARTFARRIKLVGVETDDLDTDEFFAGFYSGAKFFAALLNSKARVQKTNSETLTYHHPKDMEFCIDGTYYLWPQVKSLGFKRSDRPINVLTPRQNDIIEP